MLKRFFLIALLSFCGALLLADKADEARLLKLIPAGAEGVLSVDLTDWLTIPAVAKQLKSNAGIAKLRADFGVGPEDLGAFAAWGGGDDWAVLVAWRKNVTPEQLFKAPHFTCAKATIEGSVFYNISTVKAVKPGKKGKHGKRKHGKTLNFWLTVLPGNVFCFVQDAAAGNRYLKSIAGSKAGFAFPQAVTGSLRGVLKADRRPDLPCKGGQFGFQVTRTPKTVLEGILSVTVKSAEEAAQLSSQGMLMTNMMLASAMQDDPDLAVDLVKCLRFNASGPECSLTVKIPGELLERLGEFAAQQAEQKMAEKARKAAKPAAQPAAKTAAKPAAKPAAEPADKPVAQPGAK
ncbi:MAG: hypothetical protein IJT50_03455 [Lentisphaeria bacterium]|nr:hypothetical protein [Lentisphaeria bacterium]